MERLIGIDFGTSTSVLRTKMYDNDKPVGEQLYVQPVVFNNGASMVPTILRCRDDIYTFGYEAEMPARNSTVYSSFKLDLQSEDPEKKEKAKLLTMKFFQYLFEEYKHQEITGFLGDPNVPNTTYISYPVKWESETRDFMIETAQEAGFENIIGMDEAEAAIRAITLQCSDVLHSEGLIFDGKTSNVLLIDMGAGTTDIVICKYTPGKENTNEILTTWPKGGNITFGGQEIDVVLKDYIVSKFPIEFQENIRKKITTDKIKAWKENTVSPSLKNNLTVTECGYAENIASYMDIMLDEFCLDKEELERILGEYIIQFVQLIGGAIMDSGLSPEDIDLIVLTGGHSKWYFVEDILSGKIDKFGDLNLTQIYDNPKRILSVALPQETVALGLVYSKISGTLSFDKSEHLWKLYLENGSLTDLKEAADLGNINAINELGFKYSLGVGVEKNTGKAKELYMQAIEKEHPMAYYNLGCCYFDNNQYAEAFEYFKKAAEKEIPQACNNLAVCYKYGLGVTKNEEQALYYFKQAYELGYKGAKDSYSSLFKKLHPTGAMDSDVVYNGNDILEYAKQINNITDSSFYIGSSIPLQKINNFLAPHLITELDGQRLICYYDDTMFGGGKNGFLLTDRYFYWRPFLENLKSMELCEIDNVYMDNNNVKIAYKNGVFTVPFSSNNKQNLVGFLQRLIDCLVSRN